MKEYTVVNILDMLEAIGEENLSAILSDFSCPINKEIENFVWHNAIEFAKKKMSITYFPFLVPKLNKTPIRTKDLDYDYTNTYKETYVYSFILSNPLGHQSPYLVYICHLAAHRCGWLSFGIICRSIKSLDKGFDF